jgi:hypothetical protein
LTAGVAGGGVDGVDTGVRGPEGCPGAGLAVVGRCATGVQF